MPLADQQLTLEHEKLLWDTKELNVETSKGLLRAVIFYLVKCFAVWQSKELRELQTSHVSFGENKLGKFVALDLQSSNFRRKRLVKRYDDPANPRSVYKVMKKYRSRIANEGSFLVRPISSIKDFICYGPLPLGINVIKGFIPTLMEDAGIGRCFVNNSLNLQAINTLMRFGTGFHCLQSWLVKNNIRSFPSSPKCSSNNCEDLNPEVSVMVSRLLDAPYPCDAVEIIQKMEHEENQRSKEKESPQRFDSWMTNLSEGKTGQEMDCDEAVAGAAEECLSLNGKDIEGEPSVSHNSGYKINILSSDSKDKMSDDKGQVEDSTECTAQTDTQELKIMTVSTITEAAFSHQVDEGDQIKGHKIFTDNKSSDCIIQTVNNQQKEENTNKEKRSICGKKRKDTIPSLKSSDQVYAYAKVKKTDDIDNIDNGETSFTSKKRSERTKIEENEPTCKMFNSEIKAVSVNSGNKICPEKNKVKGLVPKGERKEGHSRDDITENGQSVFADSDVDSEANRTAVEKSRGNLRKSDRSLKGNSSDCQFSMPDPDSSQDSITILRKLLLQNSDDNGSRNNKKYEDKDYNVNKSTEKEEESNTGAITRILPEPVKGSSAVLEDDKTVTYSNDEKFNVKMESEVDLSPPTLSPQIPSSMPESIDEATFSQNFESPSHDLSIPGNESAPKQIPSDIVQFLDKAQQQINNILTLTSIKTCIQSGQSKCESSVKTHSAQSPESGKGVTLKHVQKSRSPVKIANSVPLNEESPSEELHACGANLKCAKILEQAQSQSHFPLLRLFLEQPLNETEKVVTSGNGNSWSTPPKINHKQDFIINPNSSFCSHSINDLSEPPQLTYMGNTMTSQEEVPSVDNGCVNDECLKEKAKVPSLLKKKDLSNSSVLPDSPIECPEAFSPSSNRSNLSLSSPSSSLSPSSISSLLNSEMPNTAAYHIEKDLVHDVVYQTLRVNYEKDGARTFTFADIPNTRAATSTSKRVQGNKKTSEINLGDYFPPGTLIPAKDIHLVTQQGSDGCDLVMKFSFSHK